MWGWIAPFIGIPLALWLGLEAHRGLSRFLKKASAYKSESKRNFAAAVLLSFGILGLVGWLMLNIGDVEAAWSEEVALSNRNTITVWREVKGNAFGVSKLESESWSPSGYTVDISRRSSLPNAPVWRSALRPVMLDQKESSGKWFLIAEPSQCKNWEKLGSPNPPYYQYVLGPNGWVQEPFDTSLIGRLPNLLLHPRFAGEGSLLSADSARARNLYGVSESTVKIRAKSNCYPA